MEKKIIKSICFELTAQESETINKAEEIINDILDLMETENCDVLTLEYYEVTQNYSKKTLEDFSEFLEYLPCSDSEVC